jgi:hypothetical protein
MPNGRPPRFVRLGRGLQADFSWWRRFWREYNGVSMCLEDLWQQAEDLQLWTDASLEGFGAFFVTPDGPQYVGGKWEDYGVDVSLFGTKPCGVDDDLRFHTSELELLAIAIALTTWGEYLSQRRFVMKCDNSSAERTVNTGRARDPGLMVGMREVFFASAKHSFDVRCEHIDTKKNVAADALSRDDEETFFEFVEEKFGFGREELERVESKLDVGEMLRKIRRARRAVARAAGSKASSDVQAEIKSQPDAECTASSDEECHGEPANRSRGNQYE